MINYDVSYDEIKFQLSNRTLLGKKNQSPICFESINNNNNYYLKKIQLKITKIDIEKNIQFNQTNQKKIQPKPKLIEKPELKY